MKVYHFIRTLLNLEKFHNNPDFTIPQIRLFLENYLGKVIYFREDEENYQENKYYIRYKFNNKEEKIDVYLDYLLRIEDTDDDIIYLERNINTEEFEVIQEIYKLLKLQENDLIIGHTASLEKC